MKPFLAAAFLFLAPSAYSQPAHDAATGGEAESFRDSILHYYGFTDAAADAIRAGIVHLEIEDFESQTGGVSWDAAAKTLKLKGTQQQAGVAAFARVWWDVSRSTGDARGLELDVAKTKLAKRFGKSKGGALFAELAGWTMGRHMSGAHALPKRLRKYFDPLFTGKIYRTPWYDGGVP